MRTIPFSRSESTIEEYVKHEICKNAGSDSVVYKGRLIELCEEKGVPYTNKMGKEDLFDALIKHGLTHEMLAQKYGVGVSSQNYQKSFGISHKDVKLLEKHGAIKKVGGYWFRAYGKAMYAPLYDVYQYGRMTDDDMKLLLSKYKKE